MLDAKRIQAESENNEEVVEKRFKKLGYNVTRLDTQGRRKRPEFLVANSTGPVLICEVKSIFSRGYSSEKSLHISSLDPKISEGGVTTFAVNWETTERDIASAVEEYKTLITDRPELSRLPLLVVFCFDAFADVFDDIPNDFPKYPELSGFARVEQDAGIKESLRRMSLEELADFYERGSMKGFPPSAKELRLVKNRSALVPLPEDFVLSCLD